MMKKIFYALLLSIVFTSVKAQQNISAFDIPYTQDFTALGTSGIYNLTDNTSLVGWYAFRTTGNAIPNLFPINTGTTTTGGFHNFGTNGTNGPTDRALGAIASGTPGTLYYGIRFKNNTSNTINYLSISYTGEQWRSGGTTAQSNTVDYQIGATVTSLTAGTWTNVPALTFTSPRLIAANNTDGNNPINRVTNINTTLAITLNAGEEIFIRWVDIDNTGTDHALAIDDISVTAVSPTNWYYDGTGNLNDVTNWSLNTNGIGGTNPTDFSTGVQIFNILDNPAGATTSITTSSMGTWTVGGNCRVKLGGATSNPITLTVAASNDIVGIVDIDQSNTSTGNKILLESTVPTLSSLHSTSTVEFASATSQTFSATNYGNIISSSTGDRVINNSIGIAGTYTPGSNAYTVTGSTINFNGTSTQTIPTCSVQNIRLSNNCNLPLGNTLNLIAGSTSFILNSGVTFNVSGKIKANYTVVSGSYFTITGASFNMLSGSEFELAADGGTIPQTNTTWHSSSTLNVTGSVLTLPTGRNQAFGNVIWNSPAQTAVHALTGSAGSFNVTGTFTIESTGTGQLTLPGNTLLNVPCNNFVQNGGHVNILGLGASGDRTLTVSGNFTLNGGTFMLANETNRNGTLNISGNFSRTGGSFSRLNGFGFVVLNGTTAQTVTGTVTFHNLSLNNAAGASITAGAGNTVTISSSIAVIAGNLNANGNLVIASTASSTARVATTGGIITGDVTVERFLPSRRGWRFLTAPITQATPLTLNDTWKDSVDIVGPTGNNLTAVRFGYNFLTYNSTTDSWTNVSDPATVNLTEATRNNAFGAFIPGRKGTLPLTDSTNVTLRSTGALRTGLIEFERVGAAINSYELIPNPYASPVNLESVFTSSVNINPTVYTWDPRLGGSIGTGGYVAILRTGVDTYVSTPDWGITTQNQHIQSGQAFFVQAATAATTKVVFNESAKSSTNINTVFGVGTGNTDLLRVALQKNEAGQMYNVGEVVSMYNNTYSKIVSFNEDAEKMWNNEENIALRRGNYNLSIESRPFIAASNDTIFLGLSSLIANNNYSLEFKPNSWDAGSKAYLIDKLLSTETLIDLNTNSYIHQFTSTTSTANDRFIVVFRPSTLPSKNFTLSGEKQGSNKVKVNWEAQGETGLKDYILEKSTDGTNYQAINNQAGKNGNANNVYTYTDNNPVNGVNYYRVKTIQLNDMERYSSVITINFKSQTSNTVSIYPNPSNGNQIGLQLQNIEKGTYQLRIMSIDSKEVYKQQLPVNSSSLNTTISPTSKLVKGTYTLQVIGKVNNYTQKLVVE